MTTNPSFSINYFDSNAHYRGYGLIDALIEYLYVYKVEKPFINIVFK
mgnify:CR=1 FL=1